MNKYKFEDIKLGMKEQFKEKITSNSILEFIKLSGDNNPLHTDKNYAIKNGMLDIVAHGMLTSSFYSKLVGVYLPGEKCILHEIDISFKNPVYANDSLTIVGEVYDIIEIFKQIRIKAYILNQDNKKISTAKIKVGVLD